MRGKLFAAGFVLSAVVAAGLIFFPTLVAVIALLALVTAALLAVVYIPIRTVARAGVTDPKERLGLENELRKTATQALGGGALAVTLFSGIGSYLTQQRTARLTEEREYSSALAKNISDLQQAPVSSPARVGAIYALGQLASAADARVTGQRLPYGRIVAQVLSTFVRQSYPPPRHWLPPKPDSILLRTSRFKDNPLNPFACAFKYPEPRPGLQAALEVLGKLQRLRPDDVTLQETDLRQAWIPDTSFRGAYLRNVVLANAVLRDSDLTGINLEEAILFCADMQRVDLRRADLHNAILRGVDLRGADLRGANLSGADLSRANLTGAKVTVRELAQASNPEMAHLDPEVRRQLREGVR